MTRLIRKFVTPALLAAGLMVAPALAQDNVISAAKAAGTVGEQSDGYLGVKGAVGADVRAAVDDLNIKRRAAYTKIASDRGATVANVGEITACQTLKTRVSTGQIYRIGNGDWQVKGAAPIALPDICATAAN
jgi:uncharacterized protein YdbL (DUF1318 family)